MSYSSLGTPPPAVDIYPEWPIPLIESIETAIATAWSLVIANKPLIIATKDEDKITTELKTILVDLWKNKSVKGFTSKVFSQPTRDSKLPDFAGNSIDQMPDLTFYLVNPRNTVSDAQFDALFFECKVLKNNQMSDYAYEGISRFVEGKYAWRMKHAGMIAYDFRKKKNTAVMRLKQYFDNPRNRGVTPKEKLYCLGSPFTPQYNLTNFNGNNIAITIHERPNMGISQETYITLRHIWLQ